MKNNSLGVCALTLALLVFQLEVPAASAGVFGSPPQRFQTPM